MAKQLKQIFSSGSDEIAQSFTIESWHVSQSVDALTGADDYDITISGSLTITGSTFINGIDNISQTDVLTIDTTTGQLYYTASNTLDLSGASVDEALRVAITVKNVTEETIAKGTPCFITASGASGNIVGVIPASASNSSLMPAGVVTKEQLEVEEEGIGIVTGFINGVDTSLFSSGDNIYVGANGGYTNIKPTGSNVLIQKLGNVEKVDAANGSGVIVGAGRANDVPNITPGYAWVGNSDGVATPVATSSFAGSSDIDIYDYTHRATGSVAAFRATDLQFIMGTSYFPGNDLSQSIEISEIADLTIGQQVTVTATFGLNRDFSSAGPISVFPSGSDSVAAQTIDASGTLTFLQGSSVFENTPFMYHIMYTTSSVTSP